MSTKTPARSPAGQVLDLFADFEDWTEIGREPDAVVTDCVLTLSAPLLAQILECEHGRRLLQGGRARVFVAPDRQHLAVALGVDGIPVTMTPTTASLRLHGWTALVGDTTTEWRVAEIPATGVVHLVFERSGEGRVA